MSCAEISHFYRVTLLVVAYLGWVDIDLDAPPYCTAAQSILPSTLCLAET